MSNVSAQVHPGQIQPKYHICQVMGGGPYFIDLQIDNADLLTLEQLEADLPRIIENLKRAVASMQLHISRKATVSY